MRGKYSNFSELALNEREGEDYTIVYREVDSRIAIIAPHGGGIEPGTIDIADAVASLEYTLYGFKGVKKNGNYILHINSNAFDEPSGAKASRNSLVAVTIHGCQDKTAIVLLGGRNQELKQYMLSALKAAGFAAAISEIPGLRGIDPENICNRCTSGKGVQLEISRGLRERMFDNLDHRLLRKKTILFYSFVHALREALLTFDEHLQMSSAAGPRNC